MHAEVVDAAASESGLSDEQRDFLHSLEIALEGVMIFALRLAEKIRKTLDAETDPEKRRSLEIMLENSASVPLHPAETFHQAVQSAWTVKTAVELAHPVNLHCFGRMDQIFHPYYEKDIAEGRITRDKARNILEELLLKTMSQNIRPESNILSNFYHRFLGSSPVTIGGIKPDGTDGTNDLTYLFLEAAKNSRAVTNVSLRVHRDTPDELLLDAADTMYAGSSNISLFNDDINIEAMRRRGFAEPDARNYAVMGCVEMLCPGKTGGMSANALLLARLLDTTLRNGDSLTLMGKIKNVGLKTGDPAAFTSFEQMKDAFLIQAKHQTKLIADASNIRDRVFAKMLPAPYISAFIEGCLENKKDVTGGGAVYDLSGISFINSIANVVDSLYVIKKLVFEQHEFTMGELIEAISKNYIGYEVIHRKIKALEGKWGNGFPEMDELAREVTSALFEETYKYKSYRGGAFVPYVISMTTHTIDGRLSIATPDGRPAATPYAASCNPYNVEKSGVTAAMRSVAALDFRHVLGCAVNMKFHPSAIGEGEETRRKWIALLRTYFQLGGAQLQPTVVSSETLRAAQKTPDNHRDLIVKVGGYSAYFTELGREIQNEIIGRTEHDSARA
jgi:formate C-acetyltransferase